MISLKMQSTGVIIDLKTALPVSFAGKSATANTFKREPIFLAALGGEDAAPTCKFKGLIVFACNG